MPVVAHAHDEIISERNKEPLDAGIYDLISIMSAPIQWAENFP